MLNFAFGSNLDPRLMSARCAYASVRLYPARLRGWRLVFAAHLTYGRADGAFASIRPVVRPDGTLDPSAFVDGLVYEVSTSAGVRSLDRCEGVPYLYTRERVTVSRLDTETSAQVETYLHCGGVYGNPGRHYLDGIIRGYEREGFNVGTLAGAYMTACRLDGHPMPGLRLPPQTGARVTL